jgi:hypothetical protein
VIRGVAVTAALALASSQSVQASCIKATPEQKSDFAETVFEGVALPGPAVDGVLITPARFQVSRYLKGDGPDVRLVATALQRSARGSIGYGSEGILPGAGEHWRIFAGPAFRGKTLGTSICSGSGPIPGSFAAPFVATEHKAGLGAYVTVAVVMATPVALGLILLRRHRRSLPA